MQATAADLEAIERLIVALPKDKRDALARMPAVQKQLKRWQPNPGPQTEAYYSEADCLLYGGEPGGGKSQLILGLAFNEHQRSLVMRREYGQLERLIEDALKIHGSRDGFNGSPPPRLRMNEKQSIYFRAAQRIGDEQSTMGQGRDLLGIDEATHFAESQVRFLMGWVRTEDPNQRCRTILATNPPLTAEGLWVIDMFAPWLDPLFPKPAKPGELRWVVSGQDGKDVWVEGPDDVRTIDGKEVRPTSRTFIPASVSDNPYYAATDYERQLMALPEEIRSKLMGGFQATFKDADFQVIPTAWIDAAQARWKPEGFQDVTMTAMAFDPAGGGSDAEELIWRHGGWFSEPITAKGHETKDGSRAAGLIVQHRRHNAPVIVDVGGGYGGAVVQRLGDNSITHHAFNGAGSSTAKTRDGKLAFFNKRAEAWWRMREELNPDQEGGSVIALPPGAEVKADLAAPQWKLTARGIQIESKDDIRDRLGRSPGKGDVIVMCLSEGQAVITRELSRQSHRAPKVVLGYANAKRGR